MNCRGIISFLASLSMASALGCGADLGEQSQDLMRELSEYRADQTSLDIPDGFADIRGLSDLGSAGEVLSDVGSFRPDVDLAGTDELVYEDAPDSGAGDADSSPLLQPWPPERVLFRTSVQSFNLKWYVALVDGRIQVKPNQETTGRQEPWRLLGETGLPEGSNLKNFGPPTEIVELSLDGVHLIALSADGAFYRGSDMTADDFLFFNWTDQWGGLLGRGDGITREFSSAAGWSIGDSHPFGVGHYEDMNGTQHSVGMGVAHIYRLGPDGRGLYFNDWWLPDDWSRQICTPDRGTFHAVSMSTSASTTFLINQAGEMYTRLYDLDTGGENMLLTYSYIIDGPAGTTRKLPAEPWRRQPDITAGEITGTITIFQNGQGNAARVLRVEGRLGGETGFFYKGIYDQDWQFEATGLPLSSAILDNEPEPASAPEEFSLSGTLTRGGKSVALVSDDMHMLCSPATVRVLVDGEVVTRGGQALSLELHHVQTMVDGRRPTDFWEQGIPARVQAALLIPDGLQQVDQPEARAILQSLLGDREVINFLGYLSPTSLELEEIGALTMFRVPGDEKGFWDLFQLTMSF